MSLLPGMRIAVIGAGAIGGAVIDRLLSAAVAKPEAIVACEVREDRRREIAERYRVQVTRDAGETAADVIILAVPPAAMEQVLAALRPRLGARSLVMSFAGGVPLAWVQSRVPPETAVVRVNPNSPSIVGAGFNPVTYGAAAVGPARALADALLDALGARPEIPDRLMNLYTALTAVGPTYFLPILDALIAAGVEGGLPPDAAREAATATARGTASMVRQRGESAEQLKLLTGLRPLDDQAVKQLVRQAVQAAVARMDNAQRGFEPR